MGSKSKIVLLFVIFCSCSMSSSSKLEDLLDGLNKTPVTNLTWSMKYEEASKQDGCIEVVNRSMHSTEHEIYYKIINESCSLMKLVYRAKDLRYSSLYKICLYLNESILKKDVIGLLKKEGFINDEHQGYYIAGDAAVKVIESIYVEMPVQEVLEKFEIISISPLRLVVYPTDVGVEWQKSNMDGVNGFIIDQNIHTTTD